MLGPCNMVFMILQIKTVGDDLRDGDVILSNHPSAGGSHLPDLTVITPVSINNSATILSSKTLPCFYHGLNVFSFSLFLIVHSPFEQNIAGLIIILSCLCDSSTI